MNPTAATLSRALDALRAMKLTQDEEHDILSYLCGFEPDAIFAGLEYVASHRPTSRAFQVGDLVRATHIAGPNNVGRIGRLPEDDHLYRVDVGAIGEDWDCYFLAEGQQLELIQSAP